MMISKNLEKELRVTSSFILLDDDSEPDGTPRLVLREVRGTWGAYDRFKGGVCFDPLSDGSDHVRYEDVLGFNTGRRADVQALLLMKECYTSFQKMKYEEWSPFLAMATKLLLEAKPLTNPRFSVEALTTTRYWYRDNWYGNTKSFVRLWNAKRYAQHETGNSVTI